MKIIKTLTGLKSVTALALVGALASPAASAETQQKHCENVASIAHSVMALHQMGVSLSETLSAITDDSMDADSVIALNNLTLLAYDSPRYLTEAAQERSAATFRDQMHVICLS